MLEEEKVETPVTPEVTPEAPATDNVDTFLEDISEDKKTVFDDPAFDPPAPLAEKEKVEKPAEEKPEDLPFHKHPRFKQLTDENKDLKERFATLEGRLEEKASHGRPITDADVPRWLKTLMGDDPALYAQFNEYQESLITNVVQKVQEGQTSQSQAAKEEQAKWQKWVNDEFDALKAEGHTFNQEEVSRIALEIDPRDEEGNISIRKSLQIWQERQELVKLKGKNPATVQAKKEIAAKTLSGGGTAPEAKKVLTAADLKGKSMFDMAHS